jgi:ribosomal protein S18 acetylase RimI-like enzyme
MQDANYIIRTMSRKQVELAIEWAAREGWNPGIHDADCFYTADPGGFFIGLLGDEPVATISAVKYGESFGFLGFYIVKPKYRSRGYGIRIWNAGLKYLEGRNVGLDGVVDQQDNYRRSGFRLAYRNIRYEGFGGGSFPEKMEIVKLPQLPFEAIAAYDRPFFPDNRTQFIKAWINQADCSALGVMNNGKLAGYGVIRKCRTGYKIGPLIADGIELAETLFRALKFDLKPGEPFYLDTPEVNPEAVALAERHGMKRVFETARMYTGEAPYMALDHLFGVTSFELG